MGSNIGSDSSSEADTVEPMKKSVQVTEISDSDFEDGDDVNSTSPNAAKLKGIIERINADSDDDDNHDDPVDFGEEEEEDEDEPAPAACPSTPENKDIEEKAAEHPEGMEVDAETKNSQPKAESKKSNSPSSSKSRPKKETKPGPEKTIKKQATSVKGKSKAQKKSTATKKSAPLLKSAGKAASSHKAKSAEKGSPRSKKTAAKTESASMSKGSPKGVRKASKKETEKTKAGKPVKTIDKATKKGSEKPLLKKDKTRAPAKTFSKKTKVSAKQMSETMLNKAKTVKKSKEAPSKKQKTTKKAKSSKAEKATEEGENEEIEVASDGEISDADSSDADAELLTHTPNSKLPIIGSLGCSSRDANAQALLDHAVQQLGKYRVVDYGPDSDDHLHAYIISSGTKRGWGILQALASGAHVVSEDWLSSSISEGSWQPMSAFLSDRFGKSPRSITGADAHNRILEGVRIKVACEGQDTRNVRKLVTLCGARVAETRVDVIINDTGKTVEGGINVTKKWLADSVESGVAVEYQPYRVESS